jgi:hypothetical protein
LADVDAVIIGGAATVLRESADTLKSAAQAVPGVGSKRQWNRERRLHAYLAFQSAALDASTWPTWLTSLEESVLAKGMSPPQILPELAAARRAIADLLAALAEIRLVGNPEPRKLAEEIVTLLVELMEVRLPARPPGTARVAVAKRIWAKTEGSGGADAAAKRFPALAGRVEEFRSLLDDDAHAVKAQRFNDCQLALGRWHKKFTIAARTDIGYGPRWWQVSRKPRAASWQWWRREGWPGGWPPPDAAELVARAREEGAARDAVGKTATRPPNEVED